MIKKSLLTLRGEVLGVKLMMENFIFSTNIDMTAINGWPVRLKDQEWDKYIYGIV